jgi:tyrosine-specific transport protein
MKKNFYHTIAALIGMIIGVGIFGIPYAVEKVGFITGFFYIWVIGSVLLLVNLLYGEVILRTKGKHRLVGYASIYLGKRGKVIASITQILAFYGALIAYIIVGGQFLEMIFSPFLGGNLLTYQLIFFGASAILVLLGLKLISTVEFFMTGLLLFVVAIILVLGLPYVWYPNLYIMNLKNIFLPYGVILFALGGAAAIPQMKEMLKGQEEKLEKAIKWGSIIPIIITILFAFVVVGISGENTSIEAISGLSGALGGKIIFLGAVFGFLAIATSFLVLGLNLRDIFEQDFKLNKIIAWVLACFVPFIIFLLNRPDFITMIAFIGAIFSGFEGLLIILIWKRAKKEGERKPEYSIKISSLVIYLLMAIFILGIIYKILFPALG